MRFVARPYVVFYLMLRGRQGWRPCIWRNFNPGIRAKVGKIGDFIFWVVAKVSDLICLLVAKVGDLIFWVVAKVGDRMWHELRIHALHDPGKRHLK